MNFRRQAFVFDFFTAFFDLNAAATCRGNLPALADFTDVRVRDILVGERGIHDPDHGNFVKRFTVGSEFLNLVRVEDLVSDLLAETKIPQAMKGSFANEPNETSFRIHGNHKKTAEKF